MQSNNCYASSCNEHTKIQELSCMEANMDISVRDIQEKDNANISNCVNCMVTIVHAIHLQVLLLNKSTLRNWSVFISALS